MLRTRSQIQRNTECFLSYAGPKFKAYIYVCTYMSMSMTQKGGHERGGRDFKRWRKGGI